MKVQQEVLTKNEHKKASATDMMNAVTPTSQQDIVSTHIHSICKGPVH